MTEDDAPVLSPRPLDGITVVALEHAVAAPFATRQLADLGARVITTVSTPAKAELSRQAGATDVLDYPGDDPNEFGSRIRELTSGAGVAAVYDGVGASTFDASLAS